jgi:hypothetical protein
VHRQFTHNRNRRRNEIISVLWCVVFPLHHVSTVRLRSNCKIRICVIKSVFVYCVAVDWFGDDPNVERVFTLYSEFFGKQVPTKQFTKFSLKFCTCTFLSLHLHFSQVQVFVARSGTTNPPMLFFRSSDLAARLKCRSNKV